MKYLTTLFLFLFSSSLLIAQGEWKTLKTGAGGWLTGMDIHPSGQPIFSRSDVGGAYRLDPTIDEWIQVVSANSMPSGEVSWDEYRGVLSLVSAPSNNNRAYLAFGSGIYKSDDQGNNWIKTNIPSIDMYPNDDESKLSGERLAVDPANEDIVYFGAIDEGLWQTLDGGLNWNLISAIPSGTAYRGIRQIVFDASSGTTNGKTNTIYVLVDGEDVYRSIDAGINWASTNLGVNEVQFYDTEIDANGNLYIVGEDINGNTLGLQKFNGNSWNQLFTADNFAMKEIAIDPFNNNRAFLFSNGFSDTYRTTNLSSTPPDWDYVTNNKTAPNIPWFSYAQTDWFSLGEILFDPVVQDKIWIADGVGTWVSTDLADNNMTWSEYSKNQEHLVSNDIIALPNNKSVTAHWDRPLFLHDDPEVYPTVHQPSSRFNSSWSIDQSPQNPNWLVAIIEDHRYCCYDGFDRASGYSTDGGQTWIPFASMPENDRIFGQISVSANDFDNMVWLPANNIMPYFTTDQGQTWTQASLPGNSGNCCITANYFQRLALAADRVLANTFYIYDWGGGHIFKSSDGGATWIRYEDVVSSWAYNAKLIPVMNQGGHLLFANGPEQDFNAIEGLYRSTDGGASWNLMPGTDQVINVAVGKAAPGSTYPTIFIHGKVNGIFGYFQSIDEGQNWTNIGTYPIGLYDISKVMEGDPFTYGRLYVGYAGNGFVYFEPDAGPLAVEYNAFYATDHKKGIALHWESLREDNNKGFFVERSSNGTNWKSIGWVNGKNGSIVQYQFVDSTPLHGQNYYRLQQIDFDGTSQYSSVINWRYENWENEIQVYPNPVKTLLTIDANGKAFGYKLFSSTRQQIATDLSNGLTATIDVSKISQGLYFIEITNLRSGSKMVRKVIIK